MSTVRQLTFGELVRRHRLAAGLTQAELAERAGISIRSVSETERNLSRPHAYTISRLADALALSGADRASFEVSARNRPAHPSTVSSAQRIGPGHGEHAPLVGRAHEMTLLSRHLTNATAPVLVLMGEPGIGKSRLLAEAGALAQSSGWSVLAGGCVRRSGQQPYAPFVDLLAQAIFHSPRAKQQYDLAGCSWLVRLLPELVETRAVPSPQWSLPADQERRLIFAAVARYLAN